MPNVGHVYILLNPSHKLLKIGKTTKTPEERAAELSSTGVPAPFMVAHSEKVSDCDLAEAKIHAELAAFRVNGDREFFSVSLKEAIGIVSKIAKHFQIVINPSKESEDQKAIWQRHVLKAQATIDDVITPTWMQRAIQTEKKKNQSGQKPSA